MLVLLAALASAANQPYVILKKNGGCGPLVTTPLEGGMSTEECAYKSHADGYQLFSYDEEKQCHGFTTQNTTCNVNLYATTTELQSVASEIGTDLETLSIVLGSLLGLTHLWIAHIHFDVFRRCSRRKPDDHFMSATKS